MGTAAATCGLVFTLVTSKMCKYAPKQDRGAHPFGYLAGTVSRKGTVVVVMPVS